MRYLAIAYVLFFIGWSLLELRDLRRSRYPQWLLAVEAVSKLLLIGGILLHLAEHGVAEQFRAAWGTAIFLIVGLESMLRVVAIRHDEDDLELSPADNHRAKQIALGLTCLVVGPAAYMGFRFAYPDTSWTVVALLFVAAVIGFGLAFCWPRMLGCFKSVSERNMVEWLESRAEFGAPPDEIALLDNSKQTWPGFEGEIRCQLFRIRFGQDWYIGLTGPATHCLPAPTGSEYSVSVLYERYRDWFADHVSRSLIRQAAKGLPDDFREIVEDALAEGDTNSQHTD
jgi:hypothetical protein